MTEHAEAFGLRRHGLLRHVGAFPPADMSAGEKWGHVPRTPTSSLLPALPVSLHPRKRNEPQMNADGR
jgi:hypothetical protein